MRPLAYSWPWLIAFWLVYLWAIAPEAALVRKSREGAERSDSKDKRSFHVIFYGNNIALLLGIVVFPLLARFAALPRPFVCYWSGIVLMICGSLLRRHCWRILGEFFTGDVQARADQPVIDRGAYRFVRHPSYTAGMILFTGIGLAMGNALSLAVLVIVPLAIYVYRIRVEERVLVETIGEPYVAYMRGRKRMIPFVI